jgi:5-methylthioadenosine/S-adenosylhomocysteine deaminase
MATPCDLLIIPKFIIPVEGSDTYLTDHCVAISDGKILAVIPAVDAAAAYTPAETVELPSHCLMPGLLPHRVSSLGSAGGLQT